MTTPAVTSQVPGAEPVVPRRRVLLVDRSTASRELRADTMRKFGIEVDCAVDIPEARMWWRADLYQLVLLNVENDRGVRDRFCEDIGRAVPTQQFAFLVGKPDYLANAPQAGAAIPAVVEPMMPTDAAPAAEGTPQRWGIMEASRRISQVRSEAAARARAMRDRPVPPRDMEVRDAQRAPNRLLSELEKFGIY